MTKFICAIDRSNQLNDANTSANFLPLSFYCPQTAVNDLINCVTRKIAISIDCDVSHLESSVLDCIVTEDFFIQLLFKS